MALTPSDGGNDFNPITVVQQVLAVLGFGNKYRVDGYGKRRACCDGMDSIANLSVCGQLVCLLVDGQMDGHNRLGSSSGQQLQPQVKTWGQR